jgi:hypothetical protein
MTNEFWIVAGAIMVLAAFLVVRDRFRTPEQRRAQRDRATNSGTGDPWTL